MKNEHCHSESEVAEWMRQAATHFGRNGTLPDPTVIWLKAELARRYDNEARALRSRLVARMLAALATGLAAAYAIISIWPSISMFSDVLLGGGATALLIFPVIYFYTYRATRNADS